MAMNWDMKIRSTKRIGEKAPIRDLVHLGDWRLLYGWSWAGLRLQSVGAWELPDGNGERELGTARQRIELLKQTFAWKIQGLHLFDNTCERNMRWFLCLMDLVTDMNQVNDSWLMLIGMGQGTKTAGHAWCKKLFSPDTSGCFIPKNHGRYPLTGCLIRVLITD